MDDLADFLTLLRDELGLPLDLKALDTGFDDLDEWDSVYLLKLLAVMEAANHRRVSVADVLRARSLREVFEAVSA